MSIDTLLKVGAAVSATIAIKYLTYKRVYLLSVRNQVRRDPESMRLRNVVPSAWAKWRVFIGALVLGAFLFVAQSFQPNLIVMTLYASLVPVRLVQWFVFLAMTPAVLPRKPVGMAMDGVVGVVACYATDMPVLVLLAALGAKPRMTVAEVASLIVGQ